MLTLVLFDNLKLSALYAPGVDLKLMVTNAAAWSCHMNNFKLLNAKSLNVYVQQGSGGWILFGNNGETDPAKVFEYYRSIGKIGNEWYIAGRTELAYETIVSGGTKVGNQYTASYSISGIASGTYTMRVMKKNHVTREYTITVGGEAVTQNVKIHLKGDINGDGKVTIGDVNRANLHVKGKSLLW